MATPEGLKPIGEFQPGDRVLAYDHAQGQWSPRRVEAVHRNIYEDSLVTIHTETDAIRATVHHPVWVLAGRELADRPAPKELEPNEDQGQSLPGRWVNSHDLRPGDVLIDANGKQQYVMRIEQEFVSGFDIVNLTVEEDHTFAVGNDALLVHNSCAQPVKVDAPVKPGDRGLAGELKNRKRRNGQTEAVEIDHQPSIAAQKRALEGELGTELTKAQEAALRRNTPAVASPTDIHRRSRTYGGRNTADQITTDAADLEVAEKLDRSWFDEAMRDR